MTKNDEKVQVKISSLTKKELIDIFDDGKGYILKGEDGGFFAICPGKDFGRYEIVDSYEYSPGTKVYWKKPGHPPLRYQGEVVDLESFTAEQLVQHLINSYIPLPDEIEVDILRED